MTALRRAAEDYLAMRRAMGFKLDHVGRLVADFVGYLDTAGAERVTTELALSWATLPRQAQPAWWAQRLVAVRGFARYLQALDPTHEVPPPGLLTRRFGRATPYLYSPADVAALMTAAEALAPPFRAATYRTLIGLLAITGMRVGEAINLDRDDLDPTAGLLRLRHTKFDKSRELPLHPSSTEALLAYTRLRDRRGPRTGVSSFFLSTAGTRLIYRNVLAVFTRLVGETGLQPRSPRCRPRLHDLRHSLAVHSLLDWYRDGADVANRLPVLSTWLGHAGPEATYWYLSAAPELLALAAERLANAQGQLP